MPTCFVIQPFDGGCFDKRYEDVFSPAITKAGLEPYRVDRDPSVSIPIQEIQSGIESAAACLADISTDNPNVWFELGYAIAAQREVVLVCSDSRTTRFPFDVQHRSIVRYATESTRDFNELAAKIEAKLKAVIQRREALGQVASVKSTANMHGLEQHEVATLVSVAEGMDSPGDAVSSYFIHTDMEHAGFRKIATNLGLQALLDQGMLTWDERQDMDGGTYKVYSVTPKGMSWLNVNREMLALRAKPRAAEASPPISEDDIPF